MEYAKAYEKAEKQLEIQNCVYISIERKDKPTIYNLITANKETRIPVTYPRKDDSFNDGYKVVFYNVLSRVPICQTGICNRNEHVQAYRYNTGLFYIFETEPHSNSSKKNEDVYNLMFPLI